MTAITAAEQVGLNAVLNYNSGTHDSPTWVTITRAKDVSIPFSAKDAEVSSRASGFSGFLKALMTVGLEFGYSYIRGTDSVWTTLATNAFARVPTPIEFWAGDDDITLTGAKGVRFTGNVFGFDQDQPLEDGITQKINVKPNLTTTPDIFTT